MAVDVHCEDCGASFTAPGSMIGGIANCPDCGRITQVGGLRDPLWRGWQLLSLGVIVGLAVVAHFAAGPLAAAVAIAVGGVVAWLVSRAL